MLPYSKEISWVLPTGHINVDLIKEKVQLRAEQYAYMEICEPTVPRGPMVKQHHPALDKTS